MPCTFFRFVHFGHVDWASPSLACNSSNSLKFYFSPSLWKSLLQKNIRICRPWQAVRTALQLIKEDFTDFVRRLSIIMVEDAILHPMLPVVIWLTIASSYEFIPHKKHIDVCLQIVYQLASVDCRDPFIYDSTDDVIPSVNEMNQLPSLEASLLKSLLARACFGGMQGDIFMLRKFVQIWYKRFKGEDPLPPNSGASSWIEYLQNLYGKIQAPVSLENVNAMTGDDCVLSAVDFHCSPLVENMLMNNLLKSQIQNYVTSKYGPQEDVFAKVKSLIWLFRSSVNLKNGVFPGLQLESEQDIKEKEILNDLWQEIRDYIDTVAFHFMNKKVV